MKPDSDLQPIHFQATLFRTEGKGGWTFVTVPADYAPPVTGAWGMTPVRATVDGLSWDTTVWKDKEGRSYLPVPKKIRGSKEAGSKVSVSLLLDLKRASRR